MTRDQFQDASDFTAASLQMLGKFWDHFWYLSLLHFAHNTKNGSSNDRTRLFFCNVMHLHTENCFHFIFLCAFCASIATLLSVVHLALKRWKRNFSRCLFFHIVSQCLKITQYCLIFRFFRIKIQSVDPFSIRFFR